MSIFLEFKTSNVNSFSTYPPSLFKHLSIFQQVCACLTKKTKSAAVQATDEWPIAPPYLRQISVHSAFSSSDQKDDSHWVLNPGCMVDVVTPLTPSCQQ